MPKKLTLLPEMMGQKPPAAPTIEIDASLIDDPEAVFFDFDVFYDMGRTAGLTDQHVSDYTTLYTARKRPYCGRYIPRTHVSKVSIPSCKHSEKRATKLGPEAFQRRQIKRYGVEHKMSLNGIINETTIHEFGHYIDHRIGNFRICNVLRNIPTMRIVGDVAIDAYMSDITGALHLTPQAAAVAAVGMLGCTIVDAAIFTKMQTQSQLMDPLEGPAYLFQAHYADTTVIDFSPR